MAVPKKKPAETDLYKPIYNYLTKQGYTVRSEVMGCDVAATRDEDLIIIELKRSLNVSLLAQGVERQRITDSVYVAVPRPPDKRKWMRDSRGTIKLLERLELGLIWVATGSRRPPVEVILHPRTVERRKRTQTRRAVLSEIDRRSGDFNLGGSCRKKIVTAYRENAVQIACCLAVLGPLTPKRLRDLGTGKKTLSILYKNVYSWFERPERGLYMVNERGLKEIAEYPELMEQFRRDLTSVIGDPAADLA